jgi:4-hydroxyproline epimerase
MQRIEIVDSHTEGEPTRTVVAGWPELRGATLAERRDDARARFDQLRTAIDTPVGTVTATLHDDGSVSVENVPSRCIARDVAVDVPGVGRVTGDVAYGGNWFFLTELAGAVLDVANVRALLDATTAIRKALAANGITGSNGAPIDHVEVFGPPSRPDADARNFVLCPGSAYDRSPCGTGTSAKMAALHARGVLAVGASWRQESVIGSLFIGVVHERDGELIPTIRGRAYITAEATLVLDDGDPYRYGLDGGPSTSSG